MKSHKQIIDEVLKKISTDHRERTDFCDMGCGDGHRTTLFLEENRKITGIDEIDYHSDNYKKFNFTKGDILRCNFDDEVFDMVFSYDVIEHLENPDILLDETYRILKPGGIFVLSTPNKYRLTGAVLILLGLRKFPYCLDEKNKHQYHQCWHIKEYTDRELKSLVAKKGFGVIKTHKVFYGFRIGIKYFFNLPLYHNIILVLKKKKLAVP